MSRNIITIITGMARQRSTQQVTMVNGVSFLAKLAIIVCWLSSLKQRRQSAPTINNINSMRASPEKKLALN